MADDKYIQAFKYLLVGRPNADGEWRAYCPQCETPGKSKSPSASFNFTTGLWHCMSCGTGARIRRSYQIMQENNGKLPRKSKSRGDDNVVPIKGRPLPSEKQIMIWHKRLVGQSGLLRIMKEKRGLTKETLRKYKIGFDNTHYTIPIYDEGGELVNIRRYKPNAREHKDKMRSWGVGTGQARLYGFETLKANKEVLLCEGEMDRLIALQYGLPAVTHTGGAAVFDTEWAKHFAGKIVYIAYDEDKSGDLGAAKAASVLKHTADAVYRVKLDTDIKGGDVTDFFVTLGGTADSMREKMREAAPLYVPETPHEVPTKGKRVTVEESQNPAYTEPLEMVVMVAGKQTPPYIVPRSIHATCDQAAGQACSVCPMNINDGEMTVDIDPDDPSTLQFIDVTDKRGRDVRRRIIGARCDAHIEIEDTDTYTLEELVVQPSITYRSNDSGADTHMTRKVFNVGTYRTPSNQVVRVVGNQVPDPRNQRGTFLGWHLEQVNTDIDNFKMTPSMRKRLSVFQAASGQSPLEKCKEIAADLSANVTRIYGRDLLHVAYDLVWHSVLSFNLEGQPVIKGWLECMVIGDTRTGKSETAQRLIDHYRGGVLKSCETVSLAGLVGLAVQPDNGHWMVTWGLIPLNDRRLIVLDEFSGMFSTRNGRVESKNIIEAMSSIRSEGKAQITKAGTNETSARTRLIWLSNPRGGGRLKGTPGSGMTELSKLIQNPEDIARFDFAMAVSNDDVPSSVINSTKHKRVAHRYTSDLCHDLVMWAWSRRPDQIRFGKGVEEYIYAAAEDLGSRYVADPPLVQIENVRVKVARIAVALAARTFSTTQSGQSILVKRVHVRDALRFLDEVYGQPAMGYAAHSKRITENDRKAAKAKEEAGKYLKKNPQLVEVLTAVGADKFRPRDFEEYGAMDRDEVQALMAKLLGWRMVQRKDRGYLVMSPALVHLLEELEAEGD